MRLTGLGQVTLGDPGRVGAAHEVDEVGIVHGEHRIEAEVGRFDDRRPRRDEPVVQHVAAFGLLVAGLAHTQPVAAIGRVAAMARRPDDRHPQRASRRPNLGSPLGDLPH